MGSYTERPGNDINGLKQLWMLTKKEDTRLILHIPFLSGFGIENPDMFCRGLNKDFYLVELDLKKKRISNKPKALLFKSINLEEINFFDSSQPFNYTKEESKKYQGIEDSYMNPLSQENDTIKTYIRNRKFISYFFDLLSNLKVIPPLEIPIVEITLGKTQLYPWEDNELLDVINKYDIFGETDTYSKENKRLNDIVLNPMTNSGNQNKFIPEKIEQVFYTGYLLKYLMWKYNLEYNEPQVPIPQDKLFIPQIKDSFPEWEIDNQISTSKLIFSFKAFTELLNTKFQKFAKEGNKNNACFVVNNRLYNSQKVSDNIFNQLFIWGANKLEPITGIQIIYLKPKRTESNFKFFKQSHVLLKKNQPLLFIPIDYYTGSDKENIDNKLKIELSNISINQLPEKTIEELQDPDTIQDFEVEKIKDGVYFKMIDNGIEYPFYAKPVILGYKNNIEAGNVTSITSISPTDIKSIQSEMARYIDKNHIYVEIDEYLKEFPKPYKIYPILEKDFYFVDYQKKLYEPLPKKTYTDNFVNDSKLKDIMNKTFGNFGVVNLFQKTLVANGDKLHSDGFFEDYFAEAEESIFNFYLTYKATSGIVEAELEPLFLTEMGSENFIEETLYNYIELKISTLTDDKKELVGKIFYNYKVLKSINKQEIQILTELFEKELSELTENNVDDFLKKLTKKIKINYKSIETSINKDIIPGSPDKRKGTKIPVYFSLVNSNKVQKTDVQIIPPSPEKIITEETPTDVIPSTPEINPNFTPGAGDAGVWSGSKNYTEGQIVSWDDGINLYYYEAKKDIMADPNSPFPNTVLDNKNQWELISKKKL